MAQRWCWVGCLLIAAQAQTPGHLEDSSGDALATADISVLLGVNWHTVDAFLERALAAGKLSRNSSGTIRVAKWDQRQEINVRTLIGRSLGPVDKSDAVADPLQEPRRIVALSATPHIRDPAIAAEAEAEAELLVRSLAAAARDAGPRLPVSISRLEELCTGLRGADQRTPRAVASVLTGLSEFDLYRALERVRSRRPRAENEARYLVGTLKAMQNERVA